MLEIRTEREVALPEEFNDLATNWHYIMAVQLMLFGMQRLDADTLAEFKARLTVEEKLIGPVLVNETGRVALPLVVVEAYAAAVTTVNVQAITRPEFLKRVTADFFREADRAKTERAARDAEARQKARGPRRIG